MKKKISIKIDEKLHQDMKKEAIERNMIVSDLYEEMIKKFLYIGEGQTTLDDKIE